MSVIDRAHAHARPWIIRTARIGYGAMGVVYGVMGLLTLGAAFGKSSATDPRGALVVILQQPFGRIALVIIAIGMAGFVLWRFADAARDLSRRGSDAKGLAIRIGTALRAVVYAAFAFEAAHIAWRGFATSSNGEETKHWTARAMHLPMGRIAVVATGAGVVIYAAYQIVYALRARLTKNLTIGSLAPKTRRMILHVSRAGIAARGVVFGLIGYFIFEAGMRRNPSEARGMGSAIGSVRGDAYGVPLLIVIGLGLIAYAVYQFVNAAYRRIRT